MRTQAFVWHRLCVAMLACVLAASAMAASPVRAQGESPSDSPGARAHQGCHDFAWDVRRERTLFAGQAHSVQGGTSAADTPTVHADRLYEVQLAPQPQVKYVTTPGKVMLSDGAYGGMVKFTVARSGSYRVSLDAPFWIDVVADGKLLGTQDFSGQRGCANPRKIVIFQMPAGQPLWLQISGARRAQAQLTLTAAPRNQAPAAH
ncbi:MAG TPA: hypothetical protein VMF64_00285 [Steroidobacteraceae bacterium]|nr:hypothetical protein [Steroidobacteraceae bacterium]